MSKEVADLVGRLNGQTIALVGMLERVTPPEGVSNPTHESVSEAKAAAPPWRASKEDYDQVKKLVVAVKALCSDLEHHIDKDVPPPPLPQGRSEPTQHPAPAPEGKEAPKQYKGK